MSKVKKGRTLRTAEQQREHEQSMIDRFNSDHPVGSKVWYWTSLVPGSPVKETVVRHAAYIMDAGNSNEGQPVVFLRGISGYVSIFHVQPIDEDRRDVIRPYILV